MKSRIALITKGFTGSTFPLAKQFLHKGYAVDIYLFYYVSFSELEAFNCSYSSNKYGVEEISPQRWLEMFSYLGSTNDVRLFSLKMPRPYESIPVLKSFVYLYSKYFISKSVSFINSQNYSVVNIIGGYYSNEYLPFIKHIQTKIVVSLHEVCDHYKPDFKKTSPFLQYLFDNSIDIIIYSDNSFSDILNYNSVVKNKLHRLNFGLFETFKTIPFNDSLSLPKKYFLFFGSILPYKGLPILNDAIKLLSGNFKEYKVVVAGKGNDSCLDDLGSNPNVQLINKRLSNAELCEVITKSSFVICPYISMSQSGIPQTVFAFNKPIIASDLEGFKEVVIPNENGQLFTNGRFDELALSIEKFINNEQLLVQCSNTVSKFEEYFPNYSWLVIAETFITKFLK